MKTYLDIYKMLEQLSLAKQIGETFHGVRQLSNSVQDASISMLVRQNLELHLLLLQTASFAFQCIDLGFPLLFDFSASIGLCLPSSL